MRKKIAAALLGAMMFCGNVFAMTFEQPEKLGTVIAANVGGFAFKGNYTNNGKLLKSKRKREVYTQGIAKFGSGKNMLYFHYANGDKEHHYKNQIMAFGGEQRENTIDIRIPFCDIYQASSDEGIILYMMHSSYDLPEENDYILIGRRNDGHFVKYIDTRLLSENYFGKAPKVWSDNSIFYDHWSIDGATITIEYQRYHTDIKEYVKEGEFRFKWDDAAQWFGVEQVVY